MPPARVPRVGSHTLDMCKVNPASGPASDGATLPAIRYLGAAMARPLQRCLDPGAVLGVVAKKGHTVVVSIGWNACAHQLVTRAGITAIERWLHLVHHPPPPPPPPPPASRATAPYGTATDEQGRRVLRETVTTAACAANFTATREITRLCVDRVLTGGTVGDAVAAATHYPSPDESFEVPRSTDTPIGDAQDPRQAAYSKYLRTSGGGLLAVVLLLGCNAWAVTTRLAWCCLFQRVGHDHLMQGKASELASSLTLGHRSSLRSSSFTNTLFSASRGQHCRWDVMCGSHAFRGGRLQHPTRAYLPAHPHTSSLWGCVLVR